MQYTQDNTSPVITCKMGIYNELQGRHVSDRIVVGFTTTYICNQCLSSLMLRFRIKIRAMCATLYDKVCQWLATARWFFSGPPVSSTNKTDNHDITEILLKVALNTIKPNQAKFRMNYRFEFDNKKYDNTKDGRCHCFVLPLYFCLFLIIIYNIILINKQSTFCSWHLDWTKSLSVGKCIAMTVVIDIHSRIKTLHCRRSHIQVWHKCLLAQI
jgi:hypothetical protein